MNISAQIHHLCKTLDRDVLFVLRTDEEAESCYNLAKFFAPNISAFYLPGWDTIAYDRVSPAKHIMSQRAKVLSRLSNVKAGYSMVFTTAANLLQKVPPKNAFNGSFIEVNSPSAITIEDVAANLLKNGFIRGPAAIEPSEFAQRGEILDMVISQDEAYRLTFEWNRLYKIRTLDPLSQVSKDQVGKIEIYPSSEMIFSEDLIEHFKGEFLKLFTVNRSDYPLYLAIAEGRYVAGVEQLLPLCHEDMVGVWEYLKNPHIICDSLTAQIIQEAHDDIDDFYSSRITSNEQKSGQFYPAYKPEMFYFEPSEVMRVVNASSAPHVLYESAHSFYAESITQKQTIGFLAKEFMKQHLGKRFYIFCPVLSVMEKIKYILSAENINTDNITFPKLPLPSSFITKDSVYLRHQDLIGEKRIYEKASANKRLKNILSELETFEEGDLVVHEEHGIAQFAGVENIEVLSIRHDCIKLVYDGGDKLYIPVENIDAVKKYGSNDAQLDRLGGASWQRRKSTLKNRIGELARKLIAIAAARKTTEIEPLVINEGYDKFCHAFPYNETEDQLTAIKDIEEDLVKDYPMDRMICGDVGFGKTEVAMRAAFLVAKSGKQVAIISPTTILSRQHFNNFRERFAGTGLKIAQLSRLTPSSEVSNIQFGIREGKVDIVIGTHKLLAESMKFNNLGMMIVDEEQHFGVMQKERLKELKSDIHSLALSATPIPRTLQMSMIGIRDLSIIATPPIDRLFVKTNVIPNDSVIIREALMREYLRGGKSFYVAPRIKDLEGIEKQLRVMVPELKYIIAHGKMPASSIDKIMTDFYDGKYDILLCTTIIESGIDIPTANTMIIHKAEMMGLSQLYQLRGRVGRGKLRGFAYLVVNNSQTMTHNASKRLDIIQNINSLGAGFTIASYDSDIRGFGNLVGDEQSGHIKEVGAELYQEMLETAISELQHTKKQEAKQPNLRVNLPIYIPDEYIEDGEQRLATYKRISMLADDNEIEQFRDELIDRFGVIPKPTETLLYLMKIKQLCKKLKISDLDCGPSGIVLQFLPDTNASEGVLSFAQKNPKSVKIKPNNKLIILFQVDEKTILGKIYSLLQEIMQT